MSYSLVWARSVKLESDIVLGGLMDLFTMIAVIVIAAILGEMFKAHKKSKNEGYQPEVERFRVGSTGSERTGKNTRNPRYR